MGGHGGKRKNRRECECIEAPEEELACVPQERIRELPECSFVTLTGKQADYIYHVLDTVCDGRNSLQRILIDAPALSEVPVGFGDDD